MIMLKLLRLNDSGDRNYSIEGTVKVQRVVLREGKAKNWTTARFTQQVNVALKEIE